MSTWHSTDLQPSHLILAIHRVIFVLTARQRGFFAFRAKLWLGTHLIALVTLNTVPPRQPSGIENISSAYISEGMLLPPVHNLASPSGEFIDSKDPHYKIRWKYDGLPVKNVLFETALIDTLATLASQNHREPFRDVTGYSVEDGVNSVVLSIVRKSGQIVDHNIVIRAFVGLISQAVYGRESLAEMDFQFLHDNVEVASGVLFRPERPGNADLPEGSTSS